MFSTFLNPISARIRISSNSSNDSILTFCFLTESNASEIVSRVRFNALNNLYENSKHLYELDFNVNVGNVVWNQCKKDLTDDENKTRLIYSSDIIDNKLHTKTYANKDKKNYINKEGDNSTLLVINRGYGMGDLSLIHISEPTRPY